ncbi:hypothetical protein ACFHW2_07635 [Actinomadura sp. LOL_016]|uniref:hypothetical protein n=1 Tax=Actinomadura sp. LOL_016 TaxID=3345411 RepID=UPI003A856D3F
MVVERGFAAALDVRVGDRVTVAGRSLPVAGIAVSAAHTIYPGAQMMGPGGPSDYSGLVWMSEADTGTPAAADLPVTSLLYLKLRDPDTTQEFVDSRRQFRGDTLTNFRTWQSVAEEDERVLRQSQPVLVIGSRLLGLLAVGGLATLAAGRATKQTRRVGCSRPSARHARPHRRRPARRVPDAGADRRRAGADDRPAVRARPRQPDREPAVHRRGPDR